MSFYIKSLFIAVPIFMTLILLEAIVARRKGLTINRASDVISSLSPGSTNTLRDSVKIGIALISYSWLVKHITIYKLEPVWLAGYYRFYYRRFFWVLGASAQSSSEYFMEQTYHAQQ